MTTFITPPDIDLRRKALDAWIKMTKAEADLDDGNDEWSATAEQQEKLAELYKDYQRNREAVEDAYVSAKAEILDPKGAKKELRRIAAAARAAYESIECADISVDLDDNPEICAATGAPILEDDETVSDDRTGQVFLRSAVGLPPRCEAKEDA